MAAATGGAAGLCWFIARLIGGETGAGRLTHRIGERFEVVAAGLKGIGIRGDPHDLPTARSSEPVGMHLTYVVAVRFGVVASGPTTAVESA